VSQLREPIGVGRMTAQDSPRRMSVCTPANRLPQSRRRCAAPTHWRWPTKGCEAECPRHGGRFCRQLPQYDALHEAKLTSECPGVTLEPGSCWTRLRSGKRSVNKGLTETRVEVAAVTRNVLAGASSPHLKRRPKLAKTVRVFLCAKKQAKARDYPRS